MEFTPGNLLTVTFATYAIGAVAGLCCLRHERPANLLTFGLATLASACGLLAGVLCLAYSPAFGTVRMQLLPTLIPYLSFSIRVDALSAFFLVVVSAVALAISIYSLGYMRGFYGRKSVGLLGAFYNVMLLATTLVVTADNAFFFLMVWEIMALTAYCLVSFEHEQAETRRAGVLFFVMSHIGTGCIMLGFLMLFQAYGHATGDYGSAAYSFDNFHALGDRMSSGSRDAAFLLFLAGFGIKSGIVPLHTWLPAAHPVAPSNVSAFLSGVLIKTGIYGMARVFFDFLPGTAGPPMWWGVTVLSIGTISAVLGVLYALMQHDLKRLLAYHSIENIGIILMGFGAALLFRSYGHPQLAALALIAGLFHTLNHGIFKCLLFLGAGGVVHGTGTRNMERMGGLIRRMPSTALYFLIGAIAISGLPPLNGFVSEWFTYQALLAGFGATPTLTRLAFPVAGAMLALTAALAAACFVKAFGITFLALPRSEAADRAHEVSFPMRSGMAILALACVLLGLGATWLLPAFDPITSRAFGIAASHDFVAGNGLLLTPGSLQSGSVSTAIIALLLVAFGAVPL